MIPVPLTSSDGDSFNSGKQPLNRMNHYSSLTAEVQQPTSNLNQFQPLSAPPTSPPKLPDVVQPPMPPTQPLRPPQPVQYQQPGTFYGYQQQNPSYPAHGYPPGPPQSYQPQPQHLHQPPPLQQQTNMPQQPPPFAPPPSAPTQQGYPRPQQTYPQQPGYPAQTQQNAQDANLAYQMAGMSVSQGINAVRGMTSVDLMQHRHIMPPKPLDPPTIPLMNEYWMNVNCRPDIFRCTMTRIPETSSLLQKCRLPLGILIHPFKDLNHLPVVQCQTIVRCRACRTYINPFVHFVDKRRWKCNLCFRTNDIPEEFLYDPQSSTYGDPGRRPEVQSATIEFIAPSEYMLRPPQQAAYLFLLDVSWNAIQSGYLKIVCDTILANLDSIPGDSRTLIGFITYNSAVHFFSMSPELTRPHMMVVKDIDDIFLATPDTLLVNFSENRGAVEDLLSQIPGLFVNDTDTESALGSALEAAHKLMSPIGGRITVFQSQIPNVGPGALKSREDPNQRAGKDVPHLNPATDFYKRIALDCSAQQIAVDLFLMSSQYADLATLSGVSKFSGGCIHYFPGFHASQFPLSAEKLEGELTRYLTRKIGFEAVMRVRCTRGVAIHTFHGNFFVRSTDLLSLPNVNPDAGFGMQLVIEENLTGVQNVCFQAAVLYTSSKGERRIRVHTLCLPVSANLPQLLRAADQEAIVGLIAKMAVDRSLSSSLTDSREAFVNMVVDILSAFRMSETGRVGGGDLLCAPSACLIPLFALALMKHTAFRIGASTKLDERFFAMCQMKTLPLGDLLLSIYPSLYPVHNFSDEDAFTEEDGEVIPQPPRLPLTYEGIESGGAYLMDTGEYQYLYVCRAINPAWIKAVFNVPHFSHIQEGMIELPTVETFESTRLRSFVGYLQGQRFMPSTLIVMRDDSKNRMEFIHRLVEDKTDCGSSYYEFLQMLKSMVK